MRGRSENARKGEIVTEGAGVDPEAGAADPAAGKGEGVAAAIDAEAGTGLFSSNMSRCCCFICWIWILDLNVNPF